MNEDYVSFELAKLLKEKGFDWPCQAFYTNDGALIVSPVHTINDEIAGSDIACPTLYIAQKWLRHKKDVIVHIDPCAPGLCSIQYVWWVFKRSKSDYRFFDAESDLIKCGIYEDALQAGILEALKFV